MNKYTRIYPKSPIGRLHDSTTIQYYCNIVSLAIHKKDDIDDLIEAHSVNLDRYDKGSLPYINVKNAIRSLYSEQRQYQEIIEEYTPKIPIDVFNTLLEYVYG